MAVLTLALAIALAPSSFSAEKAPAKPRLTGTLFFHRYSSYAAWDATLWSLNLRTQKLTQINADWGGMLSPINAHPSRDGKYLTFMGSSTGLTKPEWDIFISQWNHGQWSEPINLTGPNGKRDEDPKFSPDGSNIIYKEDGVLTTILAGGRSDGNAKRYLTPGEAESSMPFYTPDGRGILFERKGSIFLLRQGVTTRMKAPAGKSSYYPIAVDSKRFLFTRVQNSRHDGIFWGYYNGDKPTPLFFNSDKYDSSDAYPYQGGKQYIFLVSGDFTILKGGYNLMVADLNQKKCWDFDLLYGSINSDQEELGPSWTAVEY